jgi:predicted dehydrogenase
MDGFMWPHHPRTAKIKAMLKQGQIGDPLRVHGVFTFFMEDLECSNVRLYPEMGGGGLLDVGCYPIFGIRWAMESEPISVYAKAQYHRGVDVAMTGILNFADGRVASFDCGFTLPVRMGFEIVGSEGVLNIPNFWLPEQHAGFSIQRNGNLEHHHVPGFDQIALMHDHFSQAILNNTAVMPEAMEAVKTLRVLDALAKSARESRVIHL